MCVRLLFRHQKIVDGLLVLHFDVIDAIPWPVSLSPATRWLACQAIISNTYLTILRELNRVATISCLLCLRADVFELSEALPEQELFL